jgi:catechol 2,3-dioxygenase-like lactoylglutathione lyase family enzyme
MDRAGRNVIRVRLIDHVVLRTANMESMISFYSNVLGCELERSLPPETGLVQLRAGQSLIDLVAVDSELGRKGGGAPGASENNMDHFCLQIEAADESEIVGWLGEHGIEAGEFQVRYGAQGFGPSIYLQDPDGNTVELRGAKPG